MAIRGEPRGGPERFVVSREVREGNPPHPPGEVPIEEAALGPGTPEARPGGAGVEGEVGAGEAAERTKEVAREAARRAGERAAARASAQKDEAADRAEQVALALRRTAGSLREEGEGSIASYTERAAERVSALSSALRDGDVRTLVSRVEGFARREPGLFLGGSIALGIAVARFLKSAPSRERG
jgi:hypothetical protein